MLLQNATLIDGSRADVVLDGDRISRIGRARRAAGHEAIDLNGYVLLPAPADPHAHLDKAFIAHDVERQPSDLFSAINAWHRHRKTQKTSEIEQRAEAAARLSLTRGTTAVRTHVDVGAGIELRALDALLSVRERLRPLMDIQVVAFSYPLAGAAGAENRDLIRGALERGADVVGGAPHVDADPIAHIRFCLELSREYDRPVDLHMDEHMRASMDLNELARLVSTRPSPPVTASHCVSLSRQPCKVQDQVVAAVAEADISVVSCPATNLHLQARDVRTATPRGITAIRALLDAGVTVAAGGDNVQDFFHPLGCGDPLQTAALLVLASHMDVPTAYRLVSEDARAVMGLPKVGLASGRPADLLAVAGGSLQDALATATQDRVVVRRGRVVARTRVVTEELDDCTKSLHPSLDG